MHQRKPTPTSHTLLEDSTEKLDGREETDFTTLPTVYPSPSHQPFPEGQHPLLLPRQPEQGLYSNLTMGGVDQRWTSEQISDFVRKLGFLDAEKEGGVKIKEFLHLNSVCTCT